MNFFKKLFGGKSNDDAGVMPMRNLKFHFSVIPENGANFAAQYCKAVNSIDKVELDYSVGSLEYADKFLQRFSDEGLTANQFAETIFVCGCYIGEVMIRNNGGQWINQEDANLPAGVVMNQIIVKLENGAVCDPVTKAFKRFRYGETDSIISFYHVFTSQDQ